ncbi:MAG: SMP-30/gluconolactonase/LRE family protein [Desulfobacterales bacterium]|nr:SMP-30/gluconolactonase/LRE family protein [Desulfobacterales bacterium]
MKYYLAIIIACLMFVLYIVLKQAPITPQAYNPPKKPDFIGSLMPNSLLSTSELLAQGKIKGAEDTCIDSMGRIYAGVEDGKIIRILPNNQIETVAVTHGRPLGLHLDKNENLIVCDAFKGLLSIDKQGKITTLCLEAEGIPLFFTDDLDIASDGMIYFTDASYKFHQKEFLLDILESKPYGRLMKYDPNLNHVTVLIRDLYFANGVALSQNEDFILVNESSRYRITRFWLKGTRSGTQDIFIDNLPGFPDNISSNKNGTFWVAFFTLRNDLMDSIHPYPYIKTLIAKLPHWLYPKPQKYGLVLALDEKGTIVRSLHDPSGKRISQVTSVNEHQGALYLGNLDYDYIGKYTLP